MGVGENTGSNTGENTGGGGRSSLLMPPTGFTLTNPTSSSLRASWTAPAQGAATVYRVYSNVGLEATVAYGTNSVVVTGLNASTSYTMWVVTSDGTSESGQSTPDTLATNPASSFIPLRNTDFEAGSQGASVFEYDGAARWDGFDWSTSNSALPCTYDAGGGVNEPPAPVSGSFCCRVGHGTAEINIGGGISRDPNAAWPNNFVFSQGTETWYRMYAWIPSGYTVYTDNGYLKWMRFGVNEGGRLDWQLMNGGVGTRLENVEVTSPAGLPQYYVGLIGGPAPARDQWVAFEVYNKWSSDPNVAKTRCYIDGVLAHESPDGAYINLVSPTDHSGGFQFCTNYNPPGAADATPIWVDSIAVTDGTNPPPNTGSDGNPIIGTWTS